MIQSALWGALIYITVGAMIWMLIESNNEIEQDIRGRNLHAPFKFLKTVAFWGPRMVSCWPSSKWMCK